MSTKTDFPVTIDGTTYNLRFGMKAFRTVEDKNYHCTACGKDNDKTFLQTFQDCGKGSMSALALLLFAGLRINHPEITLALVDELVDACEDIRELTIAVIKAINNYYARNKPEDDTKNNESSSSTETEDSTTQS